MENTERSNGLLPHLLTSGRVALATMTICCILYPLFVLCFARVTTPHTADGSLVRDEQGTIIGSSLIAQGFTRPEYFRPRPSAVDYNAAAAGGSNLSPTNPELRARAEGFVRVTGATEHNRLPADLATTSGSGLDPDITLKAARFQAPGVAAARGLPLARVTAILDRNAGDPWGAMGAEPLVNVLRVNIELDRIGKE